MIPLAPALGVLRVVPVWAWVIAAALAWGGWQRHRAITATEARAQIEQTAAVAQATAAAEAAARASEAATADAVRRAYDETRTRLARVERAAAGLRDDADRLRAAVGVYAASACAPGDAASAPSRTDGASVVAGRLALVVRECADALQTVAAVADRDGARLEGLQAYVRAAGLAASAPE